MNRTMRRAFVVVSGLLLAFLAALLLLCLLVFFETSRLPAETVLAWMRVVVLMLVENGTTATAHSLLAGLTLVWGATLALCLAPVAVVAALGEATRLRSVIWYSGATGGSTALVPTLVRAFAEPSTSGSAGSDERVDLLLFLTGLGGGLVYWIVAGRWTGQNPAES